MRHVKNTHVNTAFLLSIFIAFIITIVSLFTSGWRRYSSEEINEGIITHHSAPRRYFEKAAIVLMALALLFETISMLLILFSYVHFKNHQKLVVIMAALMVILTVVCLGMTIGIYGKHYQDYPNYDYQIKLWYSYWLVVVALVFALFGFIFNLVLMGMVCKHKDEYPFRD